jgi:hypothetical protein
MPSSWTGSRLNTAIRMLRSQLTKVEVREMGRTPAQVFTLVLDQEPTDEQFEALVEAGCDDATFGVERGLAVAEFDREAPTLADAIASAVLAVESAGLRALRVLDEDLLTLADIADRVGQSRESIRRYASGERGAGSFPPPVNPGRDGVTFYRWSEVAPWVRDYLQLDVPDVDPALVVANLVLQARQHRQQVAHMSALTGLLAA